MTHRRSGTVLLEVLCALVLLSNAGVALVRLVASALHAVSRASSIEISREEQARVLTAHSLLTTGELIERQGTRDVAGLAIEVSRLSRNLFRVTVGVRPKDGASPLTTVLYAVD